MARSQKKQQLFIRALELAVDSEVYNLYGDPMHINENYCVTRTPPSIIRTQEGGSVQVVTPQPKELAKLKKLSPQAAFLTDWMSFCFPFQNFLNRLIICPNVIKG